MGAFDDLVPAKAPADPFADLVPGKGFQNVRGSATTVPETVLGVPADIANDPLLQFDGWQMTPDGFVPAGSDIPVLGEIDRAGLGDLIGVPMAESEQGSMGEIIGRALLRVPELAAGLLELPATLGRAAAGAVDHEPGLAMAPILAALEGGADVLREPARDADEAGFGRQTHSGADVVEALNPGANESRRKAAVEFDGEGASYDELTFAERLGTLGTFALEGSVASSPDMLAAVAGLPAYIGSRTNELAKERAANDERSEATLGDLAAGGAGATIEGTLERFTTGRLLPGGTPTLPPGLLEAAGRIVKELGIQAPLGGVEEVAAYLASNLGTEAGVDPATLLEVFTSGAVLEGGLGAAAQGTKEAVAALDRTAAAGPQVAPSADPVGPSAAPSREQGDGQINPPFSPELLDQANRALGDEIDAMLVQNIGDPDPAPAAATQTPTPERASLPAQDFVSEIAARMRQSSQEQAARTAGQPAQSPAAPVGSRPAGGDLASVVPESPIDDTPDPPADIRYGKRGRREAMLARQTALREQYAPAELVEAEHADPGEAPEPVTPDVVADAVEESAANTPRTKGEARQFLLGKIDEAAIDAPDIPATPLVEHGVFKRMAPEKQEAYNTARIAMKEAGYVTFDVPGDGKFKVRNNKAALADFRAKVEKSPGFKDGFATAKPAAPRGMTKRDERTYQSVIASLEEAKASSGLDHALDMADRYSGDPSAPEVKAASGWAAIERKRAGNGAPTAYEQQQRDPLAASDALGRRAETLAPRIDALTNDEARIAAEAIGGMKAVDRRDPREYLRNQHPDDIEEGLAALAAPEQGRVPDAKIDDLGEKIGGARKDTSRPLGARGFRQQEDSPGQPWRKRYVAMQSNRDGKWYLHKAKKGAMGNPRATSQSFDTVEEAERAIPLAEAARNHRVISHGDGFALVRQVSDRKRVVLKSGFESRDEGMRYLAANAEEIIDRKVTLGEESLPLPEAVMRKGKDRRDGDVAGQDFLDTFGFRGVEFGNWNNQAERQEVMNHAYDGLLDLADVLDVPPKALSLNGDLALAFGARGHGLSGARAHYELDYAVMNLTKMQGAGALAHEWMHAVDHYFGRQDGKAKSTKVQNKRGDDVFPDTAFSRAFLSHGNLPKSGVRAELLERYKKLVRTMFRRAEQYVEDTARAEKFLGYTRDQVQQSLTRIREHIAKERQYGSRKRAATPEELSTFDTTADRILNGDALETEFRAKNKARGRYASLSGRWSNDALDTINDVLKAVTNRGGFNAQRSGDLDRLAQAMRAYKDRMQTWKAAEAGESKTKQVPTEFLTEAKKLDSTRSSDYWSTEHEMLARAFSAYVEDKLEARGESSDFLSFGSSGRFALPVGEEWGRPFPRGDERAAINAAFDEFFDEVQARETERGVALFNTEPTAGESASFTRQREQSQAKGAGQAARAELSRQRGESDAAVNGLKAAVDKVLPGNSVQFIRGMDGLPEHVRSTLELRNFDRQVRTAALYDPETGTAYVLTDVVTDPDRAAWHAAHEIAGHHGLRGVIAAKAKVHGRTARESLDIALDIALQNPTIQKLADAIGKERKSKDRMLMAEEALAELAAATRLGDYDTIQSRYGVEVPAAQRKTLTGAIARFIDRIRNIFRAIAPDTFSDSDVAELVEGAWRYARGEGATTGEAAEQVVFHGTPRRDIQRFSLHAIGTGEGAQAFGWGLYFAGRKEVAEHYRKGLSTRDFIMRAREAYDEFDSPSDAAAELLADPELSEPQQALLTALKADDWLGFDYPHQAIQAAIREPDSFELSPETRAALDRQGQLYRVDVPEDSDLLDWDKPLAEQPPKVRAALEAMFSGLDDPRHHGKTGRHFYLNAVEHFTEAKGLLGKIKLSLYGNRNADPDAWREASEALRDAGIPGLRYLDGSSRRRGDGSYNYVIWDESAIGEPEGMLESVEYTPAQEAALAKAGLPVDRRSSLQRITDKVRGEIDKVREAARDSDALKQATFDRFHGLRMAEADLALSPEQSPYIAARMTAGLSSNMEGLMLFGAPQWDGGILTIKDGTVGLLDALKPVEGKLDQWLGWMVGRRAQVLKAQGRENNLSDADISALLTLADGNEAAFKQAAGDYLKIKNAVLDVAEQAGLIDPAARAAWDHAEYIPFYRAENSGFVGPGTRKGLAGQTSGIRTLKGGQDALADPLANIVRNFSKLIDASLKNRATLLAVDEFGAKLFQPAQREMQPAMIPLGQVKRHLQEQGVPEATIASMPTQAVKGVQRMLSIVPPTGEDVVRVMRAGKPEYYTVLDPLVLRSLTAFKAPHKNIAIKPFIWFKRLLTVGVTTTAEFVGANFLRDSASAWVISDDRFIPGWDSLKGVGNTLRGDQGTRDMMMAGSTFLGGNFYDGNPDEAAAALRRALRKKGMKDRDIEGFMGSVARSPLHLWDAWLRISGAVENANRRAVYDAAIKAGKSRTEAAFAARDLMDFAMQGDSAFIQFFADVLPFFNARLQGLYKLGRRAGTREGKRAIILRGGTLALMSSALYAWNILAHAEGYDELEEWDKDAYWHIAPGTEYHTRIPKPFEIGVVFGTGPERALAAVRHATTGEGDKPGVTWDALVRAITGTLAFNPVPQLALPLAEEWANKRFFTGRPIENMGDEGLMPEARADWYTSDTMKSLGRMAGMSPKRLEHLWLGYTAGLGGYVLDASDVLVRELQDAPERPEMTKAEWPVLGRFLRGGSPGRSKYTTLFYERLRETEQAEQTVKEWLARGDEKRAAEVEAEHKAILGERVPSKRAKGGFLFAEPKRLRKVQGKVSDLREEIEGIVLDRNLSPEQKRARIDTLETRRNKLVRQALEAQ